MGCPADEVAGTSLGTADNVVGEVVGEAEVGRQRGDDVVAAKVTRAPSALEVGRCRRHHCCAARWWSSHGNTMRRDSTRFVSLPVSSSATVRALFFARRCW